MNISSDFDTGCLESATIQGDHVLLKPRPHPFNGQATGVWTSFRIEGGKGKKLSFSFDTSECQLHGHKAGNRYWASENQRDWRHVDHTEGEDDGYGFVQTLREDRVWFAQAIPYPMARVQEKVEAWLQSPWVKPTLSANEEGCLLDGEGEVWLSPGGSAEEGFEIPPLPLYALSIDAAAPKDAPAVVLMGGNHAGEHYANHAIEGMMDWLLGEEDEAVELRRSSRIFLYPMVNPEGRYGGYTRGNPTLPQGDHNRMWGPMDRGLLPNIDRIKAAIARDVPGPVDFFLDVHNQEKVDQHYMFINSDLVDDPRTGERLPFPATMEREVPGFFLKVSDSYVVDSHNTTGKTWGRVASDGPKARFSFTMEPGNQTEDQPAEAKRYGRAMGLALLAGLQGKPYPKDEKLG